MVGVKKCTFAEVATMLLPKWPHVAFSGHPQQAVVHACTTFGGAFVCVSPSQEPVLNIHCSLSAINNRLLLIP